MKCCASATIQTLTHVFGNMLNSVGAARKVFDYLDRKPQLSTDGKLKPDQLKGHIVFDHLNFSYPTCPDKTVLQVSSELQVDARGLVFECLLCGEYSYGLYTINYRYGRETQNPKLYLINSKFYV